MVTVRAPATSANLGSGFDVFGIALDRPADVIHVEKAEETRISVEGIGSEYVPEDPRENTVGAVADALDAPAVISIDKGVRPSSGLGSSAASAAGAAVALDALYGLDTDPERLVRIAAEGEAVVSGAAHADNVAPAILGGFTIVTPGGITSLEASLSLVACLPDFVVSTRDARAVVPTDLAIDDLVETVGAAATLTAGVARDDPVLVGRGMTDGVVTSERAAMIEGYDTVRDAALASGATGVTVSGAGPAVLAVCRDGTTRPVASAMVDAFADHGVDSRAYQTTVGHGAEVFP